MCFKVSPYLNFWYTVALHTGIKGSLLLPDPESFHYIQKQKAKRTPGFHRSHNSTQQKVKHCKIKQPQAFTKWLCTVERKVRKLWQCLMLSCKGPNLPISMEYASNACWCLRNTAFQEPNSYFLLPTGHATWVPQTLQIHSLNSTLSYHFLLLYSLLPEK